GSRTDEFRAVAEDETLLAIRYEHGGRIIVVNSGPLADAEEPGQVGFVLCGRCHRWLFGEDRIKEHTQSRGNSPCPKGAGPDDLYKDVVLYTDHQHDVALLS